MRKLLYKPVAIVAGIVGGLLSELIFKGSGGSSAADLTRPRRWTWPKTPHPGGHMKPVGIPGTRRWLLLPAAVLILAGLAAGCSSSKPAYCTDAANLKTSVQNLGNADVAKNGLSSLQTALSSVKTNAASFATDAKGAYSSQTAALNTSLSALQTAITSAKGQPPVTAAAAVASAVAQVKTSASALQDAAAGKCQ